MSDLTETPVVTCFLRNRGEVLLLRRGAKVGSYQGRWGGVAGHAGDHPDAAALREIAEETGLDDAVELVRRGSPFTVEDRGLGKRWVVHPYLFDCRRRDVRLDWESTEAAWVSPVEILHRNTVPRLWTSYERVAPSVETIREDRTHGSAYLSVRALEVLRDRAAVLAYEGTDEDTSWETMRRLARELVHVRPAMAVVRNRINRVMHACREQRTPDVVAEQAGAAIERAYAADEEATRRAAGYVAGRRVLTVSRSDTVASALLMADPPPAVVVTESRPGGEGTGTAERLAQEGLETTLISDATVAHVLAEGNIAVVLVGADTVFVDGSIVNKVGTHPLALAARHYRVPFYAVAAADKVSTEELTVMEEGDPASLYAGSAPIHVRAPLFERVPGSLLSGVITEYGLLAARDLQDLGYELTALESW